MLVSPCYCPSERKENFSLCHVRDIFLLIRYCVTTWHCILYMSILNFICKLLLKENMNREKLMKPIKVPSHPDLNSSVNCGDCSRDKDGSFSHRFIPSLLILPHNRPISQLYLMKTLKGWNAYWMVSCCSDTCTSMKYSSPRGRMWLLFSV